MNKRKLFMGASALSPTRLPAFTVCAAFFLIGVLAGTAASGPYADGGGADGYVSGFSAALSSGSLDWSAAGIFFKLSLYHASAFLLGFSMLGVALIPLVCLIRGFTLAFSLAVLARLGSFSGAAAGCLLVGVPALVAIPLLFLIASDALGASFSLLRACLTHSPVQAECCSGSSFIRFFAVLILLFLLSLGERALVTSGVIDFSLP